METHLAENFRNGDVHSAKIKISIDGDNFQRSIVALSLLDLGNDWYVFYILLFVISM